MLPECVREVGKYLNKKFALIVATLFTFSITVYFVVLLYIKQTMVFHTHYTFPISSRNIFLFLSKYIVIMVFSVLMFTILGSYFISKNWAKEVTIKTTIHENKGIFERKSKITLFSENEKKIFKLLANTDAEIYQKDITTKSGLARYQVSRILSRFESYGIIQKERYGMTNLITLTINPLELEEL